MAIDLHPECRERIVELVAAALEPTIVTGRQFPDANLYERLKDADQALPARTTTTAHLHSFINDAPIENFVVEELHKELSDNFEYTADSRETLTDLDGFEDPTALAEDLVARLETLPWNFELMVPLPQQIGDALLFENNSNQIQLSEDLELRSFTEQELTNIPDNDEPDTFQLFFDPGTTVRHDQLTIIEYATGYIGNFTTTRPIEEFIFKVRAILGVLLAQRIAVPGPKRPSNTEQAVKVHRVVDEQRIPYPDQSFTPEFTSQFRSLRLNGDFQEFGPRFQTYAADQARTRLSALFSDEDSHENVIRGAQWLFDGYCSGSNLLSFIQTTVAMEILLGEDKKTTDIVGISNLLSNRCAYLIAESRDERRKIINDFEQAYSIRSRIVHEGKNRLSTAERAALNRLRWMCYRVIQEELTMMVEAQDE